VSNLRKKPYCGVPNLAWWVKKSKKYTVPNLCQPDRHFLAFSDTTRNERHRKYN